MKKQHVIYIALAGAIILLILLYRKMRNGNNEQIGSPANNVTVQYNAKDNPPLNLKSSKSCGCDPKASQFLMNAGNSLNEVQKKWNADLEKYVESMGHIFQSNTIQ